MAVKELIVGGLDENFPASALKSHDNVTIIADNLALQEARKLNYPPLKLHESTCYRQEI
jgi:hypothetical protein